MLSREDFYMIKQMRQQGAYIVDIAAQIGCSERTVRQWVIRADVPCCVTTSSPNVKCVRQKEQGESYRLKEKRKAGVLTKNTTPISDDEMVQSGQHQ